MEKIDLMIEELKKRMENFKIARSVVRRDSAEGAILDIRMEDLTYLMAAAIKIKAGEQDES